MKNFYEPKKLMQVKQHVIKQHPSLSTPPDFQSDNDFLALVKKWAYLPEREIETTAQIILPKHIRQLVEYFSGNHLKLPLRNLRQILQLRATQEMFQRLFVLWFDAYESADFNTLLYCIMQDHPEFPQTTFNNSQLTPSIFVQWLRSDQIPITVGKTCIRIRNQFASFKDAMIAFKVSPESTLGKICIDSFFTYCLREDYLALSDQELERILQRYTLERIHAFLRNFLFHLEVKDFQKYYFSGKFLRQKYTASAGMQTFQKFFAGYPRDLIDKYHRWLDYIVIRDSFVDLHDPRLIFWSKYVPYSEGAHIERTSESFIMRFERYCILEFMEKTMGPIYIYEKEDFAKRILPRAQRMKNTDLRSFLYNDRNRYVARIEHRGSWQDRTAWYLTRHRITQ